MMMMVTRARLVVLRNCRGLQIAKNRSTEIAVSVRTETDIETPCRKREQKNKKNE